MTLVTFRCSSADRMLPNRCEADADDLADARDQAIMAARSLIASPGLEDWRTWALHVTDDLGEEILIVPFSSLIARLH